MIWRFEGVEDVANVGKKNADSRAKAEVSKPIKAAERAKKQLDCIERLWHEIKGDLDGQDKTNFLTNQLFAAGKIRDKANETRPIELLVKKTQKVKSVEIIRKALSELRKQEKI